jgi:hypothetical protein
MRHVLGFAAGVALAAGSEAFLRRYDAGRRRLAYAVYLPVAAAIYPVARRGSRRSHAGRIEIGALGAYAAFAAAARDDRVLAAGWASHAIFDAVHHGGDDSLIPDWYPAVCAGYDLAVAGVLLRPSTAATTRSGASSGGQ